MTTCRGSRSRVGSLKTEGGAPRFIFFGGKGGVGKTTCAAACALAAAAKGRRVLAVSTDPAHSLGDALQVRLSSRATSVRAGTRTLDAMELDGPRAYRRWLGDHRRALGDAIEHGTWLDRDDIDALLRLSIPGIDELVALLEIVRLAGRGAGYDTVVVDTAPTGHTLRLLAAPGTVAAVAELLDELQSEHRLIREQLARVGRPEAADRLIALLADRAQTTAALLRDPARVTFEWILLPETLSLAESEDGLRALARLGIRVPEVIVNRVLPRGGPCPICDRRRSDERRLIAAIPRLMPGRPAVRIVEAAAREPRGAAALKRIGRQLREPVQMSGRHAGHSTSTPGLTVSARADESRIVPEAIPALHGARLLMVGGKGGVGKTTVAAAIALRLARADPTRRVLLMSTDPAHSLGDVLAIVVGDSRRPLPGGPRNLWVRELDAGAALAKRRADLEAAFHEIAAALGSAESMAGGGRGVNELMDLAPPGIDELLGILAVAEQVTPKPTKPDAMNDRTHRVRLKRDTTTAPGANRTVRGVRLEADPVDLVVVDTAPTGHALRLLEMPDAARDWAQLLLRVLLKYRRIVRPGRLAEELVGLSKSIRGLQALLHDPDATRFIVVSRAAAVPRLETERLIGSLRRLTIATPAVVVNAMTLAPGRCAWCRTTAAAEQRELAVLAAFVRRRLPDCVIILTPLSAPPPTGIPALERWAGAWSRPAAPGGD